MLRRIKEIKGDTLHATDGNIGKIDDVFFDDQVWAVRYFVVDPHPWLPGRNVLISPEHVTRVEWDAGKLDVNLSRDEVRKSPDIDTTKPISRENEEDLRGYYGLMPYWFPGGQGGAAGLIGIPPGPAILPLAQGETKAVPPEPPSGPQPEPQHALRSFHEIVHYHIHATDGEFGHIGDLIIDEDNWAIRYLLIDTRKWLPGRHVLISPHWVDRFSWDERLLYVDLPRETIQNSPEFDIETPLSREFEEELHEYYDRPKYWQ